MQTNPFEVLDARLSNIEAFLSTLSQLKLADAPSAESRYGNFNWYLAETGEAQSTARQRIARGEVPGVTKLGKRLLIEKALVLNWIKENQRKTRDELTTEAEEGFNQRHPRRKKTDRTV